MIWSVFSLNTLCLLVMYQFHHKVVVFHKGIACSLSAIINPWLPPAGKKSSLPCMMTMSLDEYSAAVRTSTSHKASWTEYNFIYKKSSISSDILYIWSVRCLNNGCGSHNFHQPEQCCTVADPDLWPPCRGNKRERFPSRDEHTLWQ